MESFPNEDDIAITILNLRDVNVFQIPPVASARGHKAEDWRGSQIWKGNFHLR